VELFLTVCVASVSLGLLYSTFALGLGLVLRASGEVNLAHGDSLVLATYVGVATAAAGAPVLAVLLAVALAAGVGALAFLGIYAPVQRRARPGAVSLGFLPALAVALLVRNSPSTCCRRAIATYRPCCPAARRTCSTTTACRARAGGCWPWAWVSPSRSRRR